MANNLTARQIQTAKPKDKLYRLSDGGNLYFCVRPSNSRSWQFRYKRPGQDKITYLSFGTIPICLWRKLERKPLRLASS